jgi:hypothetical protein
MEDCEINRLLKTEMIEFVVESEVIIRAVDKPFNERLAMGKFQSFDEAYTFIEKYLNDTRDLHTYFSRSFLCPRDTLEERIKDNRIVAINVVLGQFEDMIYIRQTK